MVKARTRTRTRGPEGVIVWRRLDIPRTARAAVEFPECFLVGPVRTGTMGKGVVATRAVVGVGAVAWRARRTSECARWRAVVVAGVMAVRAVRAVVTVEEAGHGCNKWCSVVYVGLDIP